MLSLTAYLQLDSVGPTAELMSHEVEVYYDRMKREKYLPGFSGTDVTPQVSVSSSLIEGLLFLHMLKNDSAVFTKL
jgi:hypothetical protein